MLTKVPVMHPIATNDKDVKAILTKFDATIYLRLIARAEGRLKV